MASRVNNSEFWTKPVCGRRRVGGFGEQVEEFFVFKQYGVRTRSIGIEIQNMALGEVPRKQEIKGV